MSQAIEDKLDKIPILNWIAKFLKRIKLPGFEGLSMYDLLEMYVIGIFKGTLTTRASAIAFSFFTAIFPFLLFIIILIPYIPFDNFKGDFLNFLDSFLPPQTSDFFNQNIFENISDTNTGGLLSTVFLISMFLMANGVNAVFSGFENAYHQQLNRNFIKQYFYALGVAIILVVILILTVIGFGYAQIYLIHPIIEKFGSGDGSSELFWITRAKYFFFVLMIYLSMATLYYFGTKDGKLSSFFSVGAIFTTFLIITTSYLFGLYIENFSTYNELYGSIGALLILLFYFWLNANIILLGHELNSSLQLLKKKCTV
ncbi:MAG: YihY/virulence factor BrkB family protein [Flavobacteriaceae bacterium]|jgi:membrane protein|nr:YihY/virulence factor BrkB family protein [Flavobacteriaceae bacterium]MDG1794574.1 YihY/virulence factor BrkB family protein [Flavobacteriaceae bacterium]